MARGGQDEHLAGGGVTHLAEPEEFTDMTVLRIIVRKLSSSVFGST